MNIDAYVSFLELMLLVLVCKTRHHLVKIFVSYRDENGHTLI